MPRSMGKGAVAPWNVEMSTGNFQTLLFFKSKNSNIHKNENIAIQCIASCYTVLFYHVNNHLSFL